MTKKKNQKKSLALKGAIALLTVIGAGGAVQNPALLATFAGVAALLGVAEKKNYGKKAEFLEIAEKKYKAILEELRGYFRLGGDFDEKTFVERLKEVDTFIDDITVDTTKLISSYHKHWNGRTEA